MEQTSSPSTSSLISSNLQNLDVLVALGSMGQSLQKGQRKATWRRFSSLWRMSLSSTSKPPRASRQYFLVIQSCRNWMKRNRVAMKCTAKMRPVQSGSFSTQQSKQQKGWQVDLVQNRKASIMQLISMTVTNPMALLIQGSYLTTSMLGMTRQKKCCRLWPRQRMQQQRRKDMLQDCETKIQPSTKQDRERVRSSSRNTLCVSATLRFLSQSAVAPLIDILQVVSDQSTRIHQTTRDALDRLECEGRQRPRVAQ